MIYSFYRLHILSIYIGYTPSLVTKIVHLKLKDNLGLLEMNKNISNTNKVSECLVNRIKLLSSYFILWWLM